MMLSGKVLILPGSIMASWQAEKCIKKARSMLRRLKIHKKCVIASNSALIVVKVIFIKSTLLISSTKSFNFVTTMRSF